MIYVFLSSNYTESSKDENSFDQLPTLIERMNVNTISNLRCKLNALGLFFFVDLIVTFLALMLLHKKAIWYFTSRNGNTGTKSRLNDHSTQRNSFILIPLECKVQINIYITSPICHHRITAQLFEAMFILLEVMRYQGIGYDLIFVS